MKRNKKLDRKKLCCKIEFALAQDSVKQRTQKKIKELYAFIPRPPTTTAKFETAIETTITTPRIVLLLLLWPTKSTNKPNQLNLEHFTYKQEKQKKNETKTLLLLMRIRYGGPVFTLEKNLLLLPQNTLRNLTAWLLRYHPLNSTYRHRFVESEKNNTLRTIVVWDIDTINTPKIMSFQDEGIHLNQCEYSGHQQNKKYFMQRNLSSYQQSFRHRKGSTLKT
ncbi:hypothetical protein FF38_00433 [Lucilia cuprina]|uniref:Uncharacterized protein n=1 Tax=Lucilia cuprina TaxID=7375 RepID=A0A0L0BMV9_LUCCU|nr:hypothetical protein FF38_00433 [Lucilia cuprina]